MNSHAAAKPLSMKHLARVVDRVKEATGSTEQALAAFELLRPKPAAANEGRQTWVDEVICETARRFRLRRGDLIGERRTQDIARARHTAALVLRVYGRLSYPQIGAALGGRNHATAIASVRSAARMAPLLAVAAEIGAKLKLVTVATTGEG